MIAVRDRRDAWVGPKVLNLKNDYERAWGWYGHFNKSEMALFSECTDEVCSKYA